MIHLKNNLSLIKMKSIFFSEYHRQYTPVLLLYSILQLSSVVSPCLCNSLTEYELGDSDAHEHLMPGITRKGYTGGPRIRESTLFQNSKQKMNDSTNQRFIFRSESKQKVTLPNSQGPSTYVQLLEKVACSASTAARRKKLSYAWDTIINKKCQELAKRSVHLSQVSAEYMLQ